MPEATQSFQTTGTLGKAVAPSQVKTPKFTTIGVKSNDEALKEKSAMVAVKTSRNSGSAIRDVL